MKKNFLYYLSPSIVRGGIGLFVIIPVSTHYLDPEHFGAFAIVSVFTGLLLPLSSLGVGWVLGGNYYRINLEERKELVFNVLFFEMVLRAFWAIIFVALGLFFLPNLINLFQKEYYTFFVILLVADCLNGVNEIGSYVLVLEKKGKTHALLEITEVWSNLLVLLFCLAVFDLKAISLVLAYFGAALGRFVFCLINLRHLVTLRLRLKWFKEIYRLGFAGIPLNLFDRVSSSIERFFIERWVGIGKLGIYSHSVNYQRIFIKVFKAFSRSFSPELLDGISNEDAKKIARVREVVKKWFGLVTIAGIGVCFFSKPIIKFLTHDKFTEAATLVNAWTIVILIYSFGVPYTQFLLAHKKIKFMFISDITTGVVSWVITALLVKYFSIVGAAAAILIYFFMLYTSRKIYCLRLGVANFEGYSFWISLTIIIVAMFISAVDMPLIWEIIIFIAITVGLLHYFKLNSYIRDILKKIGYV